MSKANITKHLQDNPNGLFLEQSAEYLGLYHGNTDSHPYVCSLLTEIHMQAAQQIIVAKEPEPVAVTKGVPFAPAPVIQRPSTGAMITMRYQAIRDKALKNSQGPSAP